MRTLKVGVLAALTVFALSTAAQAAPIVGEFSKGGSFLPVDPVTGLEVSLGTARAIDFTVNNAPSAGVPGTFIVVATSGDFAGVGGLAPLGATGTIRDFTFTGAGTAAFPTVPIGTFELTGGLQVDLLTVALTSQTATTIDLTGTVLFRAAGFDDTQGTFIFSGNTTQSGTFAFASTQSSTQRVPEPGSMALFGLGVLGLGALRRKKTLVG